MDSLAGISAAAVLVLLGGSTARAEDDHGNGSRVCLEFTDLRMTLEQNATDGDTEVVLFAKGQDDGLKKLRIVRPDGRTVAELRGNRRTIGLRELALESPEPPELERVLRSFPEGTYRFAGHTVESGLFARFGLPVARHSARDANSDPGRGRDRAT